jgi:hypothetical protein
MDQENYCVVEKYQKRQTIKYQGVPNRPACNKSAASFKFINARSIKTDVENDKIPKPECD